MHGYDVKSINDHCPLLCLGTGDVPAPLRPHVALQGPAPGLPLHHLLGLGVITSCICNSCT